ncbi:uncharacterized protein LOC129366787 [Poeciliopsis prolifica]|uniref:uncharacterized protein LOC129366787 n=1 Tax=Poeciliopsis prolifica TaxID=188132 RepID=UPI0024130EEC|nr:uncharacterized protein LOC129366787 [Poeciliopsis prolifica]
MAAQTMGAVFDVMPPLLHAESVALGGPGSGSGSGSESYVETVSDLKMQTHEPRSLGLEFQESLASPEDIAATVFDGSNGDGVCRKREFTPSERKDENYWDKRRKNNEAAKRSREKRRANDMVLERRVLGLLEENARLKAEVLALKFHFGMVKDLSDVSILPLSTPPRLTPSYTDGLSYYKTQHTRQGVQQGVWTETFPQPGSRDSSIRPCVPQADSTGFYDDALDEWVRPPPTRHPQVCEAASERANSSDGLRNLPHKLRFKSPPDGRTSSSPDNRPAGPPVATVEPNIQVKTAQQVGWGGQATVQAPYEQQQKVRDSSCGLGDSSPLQKSSRKFSGGDVSLRSDISSLSQEVAQLRRLLSQQLLHKIP